MKKITSLVLLLCMCISIAVSLTACMGGQNAWQEYLQAASSNTKDVMIENKTGTIGAGYDGYSLTGKISLTGKSTQTISAHLLERVSRKLASDGSGDDVSYVNISAYYNGKKNSLMVEVTSYQYYTLSVEDPKTGDYEWKDGFGFADSSKGLVLVLNFDMSKYFENGSLAAEDATVTTDFDESKLSRNYTGLNSLGGKYTERHTDWENAAMDSIMSAINAMLAQVEAYMEENPV